MAESQSKGLAQWTRIKGWERAIAKTIIATVLFELYRSDYRLSATRPTQSFGRTETGVHNDVHVARGVTINRRRHDTNNGATLLSMSTSAH